MANWNDPVLTSLYADFLADLKARDSDLAKMFDVGTPTNVETDTIRWNSGAGRFEKWNGTSWVELASIYNINADKLDGNDASAFAPIAHVGSGGGAHADVTGGADGFMTAADKTKLDNATAAATANELIDRDAAGRAKVVAPAVAGDIAIKSTVDDHAALNSPHNATSSPTADRLLVRDGAGRAQVVSPSVAGDIAIKSTVDAVQTNLDTHGAATSVHSATAAATANRIALRDASGRMKAAAPSVAADVAIKSTVDTVQTNLDTHAALTNPHSATAAATANRIALRDGAGRMKVADPSVDADVATKKYVDDAGGGLTLLATATASNSATIDFTSLIDSTFDVYLFTFSNVLPVSNAVHLWLRTDANAGASFDAGTNNYTYAAISIGAENNVGTEKSGTGSTEIPISATFPGGSWGNVSSEGGEGSVLLFNPSDSGSHTRLIFEAAWTREGSPNVAFTKGGGIRQSAAIVNALRFMFSSGNISTGDFKLYGIQRV